MAVVKKSVFFFILVFSNVLLYGQAGVSRDRYDFATMFMFVSSRDGLTVRESPSLNSRIVDTLPYGKLLTLVYRTRDKDTINGINDYWYSYEIFSSEIRNYVHVWVFGGYLTDRFPDNLIVGCWRYEENLQYHWLFDNNKGFMAGLMDSCGTVSGIYEIDNNILKLMYTDFDGTVLNTQFLRIRFIDDDNIILSDFSNRSFEVQVFKKNELNLRRNNDYRY
jgi:hypothetical protein